ncbi:hypothetical protein Ddye_010473 [Dipteronia dyeriana]|uniref:Uncharacterized protein n=1 Tax=Dipteronia dyeriana TaxID=168575 RepID=A0AAD9XDC8_9ROSI|nr:hypothetical protein Ddye_010473 [Dipteronia dyeriana]
MVSLGKRNMFILVFRVELRGAINKRRGVVIAKKKATDEASKEKAFVVADEPAFESPVESSPPRMMNKRKVNEGDPNDKAIDADLKGRLSRLHQKDLI